MRATDKSLLWLITAFIVARIATAAVLPLTDIEAYYWLWAQRLDWSYLDHPPMIAYAVSLTTLVSDAPFWVRLGPLLFGVATTYALFLLGRDLFDQRTGLIAAAVFQIAPVLSSGGIQVSPDSPFFLAWIVVLRETWHALHDRPRRWISAGTAMGLGLLSKLYIVFLGLGVAIFIFLHARRWFRRPAPYGATLLSLLIFLPVIYWNATHHWAMVRFILYERPGGVPPGLSGIGVLTQQQFGFLLLLFPAFVWVAWRAWHRRSDERFAYLFWTAVPALLFPILAAAANGAPHGHWLGPGYLGLAIAFGALFNRALGITAAISTALVSYGIAVAFVPALPPVPGAADLYGWNEAAGRVWQEVAALGPGAVLVADSYQVGAILAYQTRGTVPVTLLPPPNLASVWAQPATFRGANAVTVLDARWTSPVDWRRYFSRVEETAPLIVTFRGRSLRTFRIFRLYDLHVEGKT